MINVSFSFCLFVNLISNVQLENIFIFSQADVTIADDVLLNFDLFSEHTFLDFFPALFLFRCFLHVRGTENLCNQKKTKLVCHYSILQNKIYAYQISVPFICITDRCVYVLHWLIYENMHITVQPDRIDGATAKQSWTMCNHWGVSLVPPWRQLIVTIVVTFIVLTVRRPRLLIIYRLYVMFNARIWNFIYNCIKLKNNKKR